MDSIVEYFAHHYLLVYNNTQQMYNAAVGHAKYVMRRSGVTVSQYLAMDDKEREQRFAQEIGERILIDIESGVTKALTGDWDAPASLLIREVMRTNGSDLGWLLGADFLPQDGEADAYLSDDE